MAIIRPDLGQPGLPESLIGATSATRYVGGTASGAPVAGTFAVGDFVVAQNGHVFVCTVAGTPGTWVDGGSAGNLVTSVFTRTGAVVAGNADYLAVATGGLTGAVAATRYVGGTTLGPPTTGTFAVGDLVVDQTAATWICTTAGTPGTWKPSGSAILGQSSTGWSHTGDTSETKLVSVSVPANSIGLGSLEIITLWSCPNNSNNKTMRVRFGAANDLTGTGFFGSAQTTVASMQQYTRIANRGTASQVAWQTGSSVGFGTSGSAVVSNPTIDTTAQTFVVFSAQCGSSADTITLESYLVRLVAGV